MNEDPEKEWKRKKKELEREREREREIDDIGSGSLSIFSPTEAIENTPHVTCFIC